MSMKKYKTSLTTKKVVKGAFSIFFIMAMLKMMGCKPNVIINPSR